MTGRGVVLAAALLALVSLAAVWASWRADVLAPAATPAPTSSTTSTTVAPAAPTTTTTPPLPAPAAAAEAPDAPAPPPPEPEPAPAPEAASSTSDPTGDAVWFRLADCESGEWDAHGRPIPGTARWDWNRGLYEGGLHWMPDTWNRARGRYHQATGGWPPARAWQASAAQQIAVAKVWLSLTSVETQWPVCGPKVGLTMGAAR